MAIKINHISNTLLSSSGIFVFGTGIIPSIQNTVYSRNFSGKYYGDGSSLTGLAAQFTDVEIENYQSCNVQYRKGSGSYYINTTNGENNSTLQRGNYSSIIQGVNGYISNSDYSIILNGSTNCSIDSQYNLIFGKNNEIYDSPNSVSIGSYNVNNYGKDNYIIGLSNNLGGGCSIYVIGSGINLGNNGSGNTLYVNNLCAYDGIIYGNGAGITGLSFSTGDFITTGQTGSFGSTPILNESNSFNINSSSSSNNGTSNSIMHSIYSSIQENAYNNLMHGGRENVISGGANNNLMIGGCCNKIAQNLTGVAILGGHRIHALDSNTTYASNFCAYDGKFYGDGSNLTGLATGNFIVSSKCQVVAKNNTPFDICAVTRVASTYISNQNILNTPNCAWYLCDHNDLSVDDCNLYTLANNRYCTAQFSAMIIGNADYGPQYGMLVTSIKVDGIATASGVLSQNKTIHSKAFATDDVCVVVENNYLRIYVTGTQTGMNWGTRLDILGMQGYD